MPQYQKIKEDILYLSCLAHTTFQWQCHPWGREGGRQGATADMKGKKVQWHQTLETWNRGEEAIRREMIDVFFFKGDRACRLLRFNSESCRTMCTCRLLLSLSPNLSLLANSERLEHAAVLRYFRCVHRLSGEIDDLIEVNNNSLTSCLCFQKVKLTHSTPRSHLWVLKHSHNK